VVPPRTYRFFALLWKLDDSRRTDAVAARLNNWGPNRKLLAGLDYFEFGDGFLFFTFNGARREDFSFTPQRRDSLFRNPEKSM